MSEFQSHLKVVDVAGGKDSASIQGAITALGLTGGGIYVRKGTYTEAIVVPANQLNLSLYLEPGAIVKATGSNKCLDIGAGCDNIRIAGGQWRGVSAAAAGIKIGAGSRVWLQDLLIGSATQADKVTEGIVLGASAGLIARDCIVLHPGTVGVQALGSIAELGLYGIQVLNSGSKGFELQTTGARVMMVGCIDKNATGRAYDLNVDDGSFVGNVSYNAGAAAFYIGSTKRAAFTGNIAYSPATYGFEGAAGTKPTLCTVVGNLIDGAGSGEYLNMDGNGMTVHSNSSTDDASANDHAQIHSMASVLDHNATAWRIFYSDAAGVVSELALGNLGTVLKGMGTTAAPQFGADAAGTLLATDLTGTAWRVLYINTTGNVVELGLGATGTVLKSKGAAAAPVFEKGVTTELTGSNWKALYVNGSGAVTELSLGAQFEFLMSDGAAAAPVFRSLFDGNNPAALTFGQAAGPGTSTFAARLDHAHALGTPGLHWIASDTTERSTGGSTTQNLSTITVNIPNTTPFIIKGRFRKIVGSASAAYLGLKLNNVVVITDVGVTTATNRAEDGQFTFYVSPRLTNYLTAAVYMKAISGETGVETISTNVERRGHVNIPTGAITSIIITGHVDPASILIYIDEIHVYTEAVA